MAHPVDGRLPTRLPLIDLWFAGSSSPAPGLRGAERAGRWEASGTAAFAGEE